MLHQSPRIATTAITRKNDWYYIQKRLMLLTETTGATNANTNREPRRTEENHPHRRRSSPSGMNQT